METARFQVEVHNCADCPHAGLEDGLVCTVLLDEKGVFNPRIPGRGILPNCPFRVDELSPDDEYVKWKQEQEAHKKRIKEAKEIADFWEECRQEQDKKGRKK